MPQTLSHEELTVFGALNQAFPEKLHLHTLAPKPELELNRTQLLRIVDGLLVRGLVDGKPVRDS